MSRRKIEMHHYRQALMRMRQGDSDRDIAKSGLMGRRTAASPPQVLRTAATAATTAGTRSRPAPMLSPA